jgi:hypothetical protein
MLASSRPLASRGVLGATTFRPGTCTNQASRLAECCAAAPVPAPAGVRSTRGTCAFPPNMYRIFAACSTSCSIHRVMKSMNCTSRTGRRPVSAAPMAQPVMAASEMGVSRTRSGPNCSSSPSVTPKAPPYVPMSSPSSTTLGSCSIACRSASRTASA